MNYDPASENEPGDHESDDLDYQTILQEDRLGDLDPDENCELKFVIDKILEREAISILFGRPGAGKSTLAISEIVSIAAGQDLLNLDPDIQEGKVAIYWPDEGRKALIRKIRAVCEHHELDVRKVFSNIKTVGDFSRILTTENISQVEHAWAEIFKDVDCLYVDSLSTLVPELETTVLKGLEKVAKQTGIAIRLIHHPRKGQVSKQAKGMDEARGSSALLGRCAIVEQTIGKCREKDGRRFLTIGGKGSDLKYRNTPRPAERHYEMISVTIDDSKYQPTIVIPHQPSDERAELSMASESEYFEALGDAFDKSINYRKDKQADGWLGVPLAEYFNVDIAHSAKNDQERSAEQIFNRKQFESDLTILVNRGHIQPDEHTQKRKNGTLKTYKIYKPGQLLSELRLTEF